MDTPNEIEFERQLQQRGIRNEVKELEKHERRNYYSATKSGRWTLQQHYFPFAEALREINANVLDPKGSITTTNISICVLYMEYYMQILNPEWIAAVTLKTLIDCYVRQKGNAMPVKIANAIGRRIEQEVEGHHNKNNTDKEIANAARKRSSKKHSTPHYRYRSTKHITKKKCIEKDIAPFQPWTPTHRNRVGMYLLEVATMYGIVKWDKAYEAKKQRHVIYTDEFINQIIENEEHLIARAYSDYPLIETPIKWELSNEPAKLNHTGGYHLPELRKWQSMLLKNGTDTIFGDKTVELLNTLQSTAWRIDNRTLELAEVLIEKRWKVGSCLVCEIEKPERGNFPSHIVEDENLLKEERRKRSIEHETYHRETNNAYRTRQTVSLANEYKFKTFFHSWSCDWRGRFYPQQPWLQPQSTDFEKSILKFRDGCKLDNDSLYWCKSAIGAAYLGNKISFKERVKWTEENQELIKRIANEAKSTVNEWAAAKEPWQFVQLCFEWNDVVVTGKEKFWKVPIGADSTSSGLQLLSAMRRDSVGMKYSNLLEPETDDAAPEDAYSKVLEIAKQSCEKDASKNYLLPYLKYRKVGKASLMLSVYGGTPWGIRQKIHEALKEQEISIDKVSLSELTQEINKASKKVFPAAYQALKWLGDLATAAHKNGAKSLTWSTPTGDKIHCIKYDIEKTIINTTFNGKIVIGDFNTEKPDIDKEVTSFIPAVVHCYDAAVLKESFNDWQHPITLIHDDIRVLPKDMDRALERIREGFTSVVSGDALARLADDLGVSEEQLPRLPQLDGELSTVLKSRYMFN